MISRINKSGIILTLLLITWSISFEGKSQPFCDAATSYVDLSSSPSILLSFSELSHYIGGRTQVGATRLKVRVDSLDGVSGCAWKLKATIDNNASPVTEWETLNQYGSAALPIPTLDILEIRVSNTCNTPMPVGYISHFTNDGDEFWIIDNGGIQNFNQCNSVNINTQGNYIDNYGAYTFFIDYRVIPNFDYSPGIYQVSIKFTLEEDN